MSAYIKPTVTDFQEYFFRDFPYGDELDVVTDADITKAFGQTEFNFNEELFSSQSNYSIGYLLLSAHWLVTDLRNSSQGLNGQYSFLPSSKSVGSVSESYNIPQRLLDNPELAMLCKTTYGAKYLALVLPQLTGQMFSVMGGTHA